MNAGLVLTDCYTHKIGANRRHVGCPLEEVIVSISNSCDEGQCPYSVTCCKKQQQKTLPCGPNCKKMSAVFGKSRMMHSASCKRCVVIFKQIALNQLAQKVMVL